MNRLASAMALLIALGACSDPQPVTTASALPASTSTITTAPVAASTATTTTTAAPPRRAQICTDAECLATERVDYLIVTRPVFVDALQDFIAWKTENGYSVGVVSVDWLDVAFKGDHLAERMKAGMHQIRRSSAPSGTMYALLVGDTVIDVDDFAVGAVLDSYDLTIPWNTPTGFYRRLDNDPAGEVLPSDAYFVEDKDWDLLGTGLNDVGGEYGQGSMVPSIYLGRWSVRNPDDLAAIVSKTMQVSPTSELLATIDDSNLGPEASSCCDTWPPNDAFFGRSTRACCYLDAKVMIEQLFGENAPWLSTEVLPVSVSEPSNAAFDRFLAAEGAVTFLFHGWYDCIAMIDGRCIGADEMQFESIFPILDANGCYIAAFYAGDTDTLAESILKKQTGPAVVTEAGHNLYRFIENVIQGIPVGDAFWMPAEEYVYWLNPILLLGDPSLTVIQGPQA